LAAAAGFLPESPFEELSLFVASLEDELEESPLDDELSFEEESFEPESFEEESFEEELSA
jgi:hypothetical protein